MSKKKTKKTAKQPSPTEQPKQGRYRNRIKELRYVPARELRQHPFNWREHPPDQRDGVLGSLNELGWIDAALARETDDGLELIDGHLRASLHADEPVPVLVVDLTDDEARLAIATHDKLTEQASSNQEILAELLGTLEAEEADLRKLLHEMEAEIQQADDADQENEEPPAGPHDQEMELRPHEHYDYLIVLSRTTHQWHYLLDRLALKPRPAPQDGEKRIGCGRAISADKLIAILDGEQTEQ